MGLSGLERAALVGFSGFSGLEWPILASGNLYWPKSGIEWPALCVLKCPWLSFYIF